jgi:hypothetical protein
VDRSLFTACYRSHHASEGDTLAAGTLDTLYTLPELLADEAPALAALVRRNARELAAYMPDPDGIAAALAAGILRACADTGAGMELAALAASVERSADRITGADTPGTMPAPFATCAVGTDPEYGIPTDVRVPALLAAAALGRVLGILDTLAARFDTLADALAADLCGCGAPIVAAALYCGECAFSPPADPAPVTRCECGEPARRPQTIYCAPCAYGPPAADPVRIRRQYAGIRDRLAALAARQ